MLYFDSTQCIFSCSSLTNMLNEAGLDDYT